MEYSRASIGGEPDTSSGAGAGEDNCGHSVVGLAGLWIPLAVCSALLVIICTAVWSALEAYDVTPGGVPDASNQFLVLCLWFLPVSMALLAVVLFQRARKREVAR